MPQLLDHRREPNTIGMSASASKGNKTGKSILWVIDGSLKNQLHKNARLKPAQALADIGWHVRMITAGVPEEVKQHTSIDFIELTWPDIYIAGAVAYYFKLLKFLFSNRHNSDVLFFQMDSLAVLLLIVPLWQKISGRKRYLVVQDYRSLPMDTQSVKGVLRSVFFYIGAAVSRLLNVKVTAITDQLAERLNLNKSQLVGIWPSGVDRSEFVKSVKSRNWPQEDDPVRLIYVGVMTPERNLTSLIKAARLARKNGGNLTLSIIGGGVQRPELEELAAQKGSEFITIDGPYPYHRIPEILSRHDVGILPFPNVPKMNVSSAIKMFEYMAAGMPVIATRIQAHETVFADSEFVFWCNESHSSMAEAMTNAVASKERLAILGNQARSFSYNWTWEKSGQKLSRALTQALK